MTNSGELLFGQIAIANRMTDQAGLDRAVVEQDRLRQAGEEVPIGQVMLQLKIITPEQIDVIVKIQDFVHLREEDKTLGRLAVANGFASESQVQECLDLQKLAWKGKRGVDRLGEILVRQGMLSAQQRDALLKSQGRIKLHDSTVIRPEGAESLGRCTSRPIEVVVHDEAGPTTAATNPTPTTSVALSSPASAEDPQAHDPGWDGTPLVAIRTCPFCRETTDGEKPRCDFCECRSCIYCGNAAEDDDQRCRHCDAFLGD